VNRGAARWPVSDHCDGWRFFNPGGSPPRSFAQLLRWQFGERPARWPARLPSPLAPDVPPAKSHALRVSFVGHASFLLQGRGMNILLDPVWSERVSPFSFTGPKRRNAPGIRFENLPCIHAVLLSHGHYDHFDTETLARLWTRDRPRLLAPLGHEPTLRKVVPGIEVTSEDWDAVVPLGDGVTATLVPVHHWTARGLFDRNHALWAGYLIEGLGPRVFFTGDTGFDGGRPFRRVADRHGVTDLALLPIGAYEPRWFMQAQHLNPEEAVEGFGLLGARQALGYHWGTFQLTNEAAEQPALDLSAALSRRGIAPARFLALRPGQVWQDAQGA
jgi:L-ascorbate metabolism protein UlaG (beta-lactamase superfamily)